MKKRRRESATVELRSESWRVQSGPDGRFDEVVVHLGKRPQDLIHLEVMDARTMFVDLAGVCFYVWRDRNGRVRVRHLENRDGAKLYSANEEAPR